VGLQWFEVKLPNQAELETVLGRVEAAGIPVTHSESGPLITDPSGNRVLLRAD
jgi:catechol-2,3-dioxygenase